MEYHSTFRRSQLWSWKDVEGSWMCLAGWKKSICKGSILSDSSFVTFRERQNYGEDQSLPRLRRRKGWRGRTQWRARREGGALHVCEHGIFVLPTRFCYDPQAPLNISLFLQNKTIVLFNYRTLRCFMLLIGKGHGKPLQCSCLENPIGRGAWRTVSIKLHSRAWLKRLSNSTVLLTLLNTH